MSRCNARIKLKTEDLIAHRPSSKTCPWCFQTSRIYVHSGKWNNMLIIIPISVEFVIANSYTKYVNGNFERLEHIRTSVKLTSQMKCQSCQYFKWQHQFRILFIVSVLPFHYKCILWIQVYIRIVPSLLFHFFMFRRNFSDTFHLIVSIPQYNALFSINIFR